MKPMKIVAWKYSSKLVVQGNGVKVHEYSDTSANEDNSFRNHIR